jgi:putative membrane protein
MDAILASLHHLGAFSLVSLIVAELVLLRGRLDADGIGRFGRVDALYGITAGVVLLAGISRLLFGAVPIEFYLSNAFFWLKMAAFGVVGAVSVYPTLVGLRWRRAVAADRSFQAPAADARALRRALAIELAVLPVIPVSAALMARGIGAF